MTTPITTPSPTPWALRLAPPFPAVAQRILALAASEDSSAQEVGDLVRADPSFSAELLRFANSALFGARREVTSVSHAIVLVGMDRVKAMATTVALNGMVRSAIRVDALRKVWIHSLATALIAEGAARGAKVPADVAYTAGLLHNIGTLGMMSAFPEEYSRMLEVSNDFGFDLLRTEQDLFEIDHCAAGAFLARVWNFPDELVSAIASHHKDPEPGVATLSNVIRMAWRMSDALGYAAFSPDRAWTHEELIASLPGVGAAWLWASPESALAEVESRLASTFL